MQASQAACSALSGQPVVANVARSRSVARKSVLVQAAAPPPAWPGRVALPEAQAARDGPKVRLPGCGMLA